MQQQPIIPASPSSSVNDSNNNNNNTKVYVVSHEANGEEYVMVNKDDPHDILLIPKDAFTLKRQPKLQLQHLQPQNNLPSPPSSPSSSSSANMRGGYHGGNN